MIDKDELERLEEKTISSEEIYDGVVVHLYRDIVRLPNGKTSIREVIRHNGAVCVVPLTDDGEVVLVRQYRYPHAKVLLEIPAGKLDHAGESREEAAVRELYEETGATAKKIENIGKLYTTPAFVDEVIDMYLATGLEFSEGLHLDEDEFVEVTKIPLDTLCDMIVRGEVADAKTQAAVLKVKRIIDERKK